MYVFVIKKKNHRNTGVYHHLVLLESTSVNKRGCFELQIITDSLDIFFSCGKPKMSWGNAIKTKVPFIFWSRKISLCSAKRSLLLVQLWRQKLGFKWSLQGENFTCCEQILWCYSILIISVALLNNKSLQASFHIKKTQNCQAFSVWKYAYYIPSFFSYENVSTVIAP